MGKTVATARNLLRRLVSDSPGTSRLIREGRRAALKDEGTHSLFAWPIAAIARKIKGKEAVNAALYEKFHRPLKNVDEKAGRFLAKHTGAKKLFGQVDVLPTSRKMGGNSTLIEHRTHSATAPLTKATKALTPLAAALWAADNLVGKDDAVKEASSHESVDDEDEKALLKTAGELLEHAHRKTVATKLAYQMVERGKVAPFKTYQELQEKVASFLEKDLRVVEEAINMDSDMADFGKVAEATTAGFTPDATLNFYHRLTED